MSEESRVAGTIRVLSPFPKFHAEIELNEQKFVFEDQNARGCIVLAPNRVEIGRSQRKFAWSFVPGWKETLQFLSGKLNVTLERRWFSSWITFQGRRQKFLMNLETLEEAGETEDGDQEPALEARVFELDESRLEHRDYESFFRISAPSVEEGLIIAFVGFRFWADQTREYESS